MYQAQSSFVQFECIPVLNGQLLAGGSSTGTGFYFFLAFIASSCALVMIFSSFAFFMMYHPLSCYGFRRFSAYTPHWPLSLFRSCIAAVVSLFRVQFRVIGFRQTTVKLLQDNYLIRSVGTGSWNRVTTGSIPFVGTAPLFLISS